MDPFHRKVEHDIGLEIICTIDFFLVLYNSALQREFQQKEASPESWILLFYLPDWANLAFACNLWAKDTYQIMPEWFQPNHSSPKIHKLISV